MAYDFQIISMRTDYEKSTTHLSDSWGETDCGSVAADHSDIGWADWRVSNICCDCAGYWAGDCGDCDCDCDCEAEYDISSPRTGISVRR